MSIVPLLAPDSIDDLILSLNPSIYHNYVINRNMLNGALATDMLTTTRTSDALYTDANGNIINFTSNTARIGSLGLLVEDGRTNSALDSAMGAASPNWTYSSASPGDTIIAPKADEVATKVVEAAATSTHIRRQTRNFTASSLHCISVYAKAAERSIFTLVAYDAGKYSSVHFDLSNGSYLQGNVALGSGAFMKYIGNGWYRCALLVTAAATPSGSYFDMCISNKVGSFSGIPAGGDSYLGDGVSGMYFWGAQRELGAFPLSLIPTTATIVTRAGEFPVFNDFGWYNPTEGTMLCEFNGASRASNNFYAASFDDTGTTNFIALRTANALKSCLVTVGGVTQANLNPGAYTHDATVLGALAFKLNEFAVAYQGETLATDSSGTLPTVTRLVLGTVGIATTSNHINGYIRKFAYFNRRLSNSELQFLVGSK